MRIQANTAEVLYYSRPQQCHGKPSKTPKDIHEIVRQLLYSSFGSHDCNASLSPFGADSGFNNYRLPWKSWSRIRWRSSLFLLLLWYYYRWSTDALVYVLQSYILYTTGFDEGKRVGNRSSQLRGSLHKGFPSWYDWKTMETIRIGHRLIKGKIAYRSLAYSVIVN